MSEIHWLDPHSPVFPDTNEALDYPDGLLAAGGNLQPTTIIDAYTKGIFPWFSEGEPILWWSPAQRAILLPDELYLSKGSRKQLQKLPFRLTTNTAFEEVIQACAAQRQAAGTWITEEIILAYTLAHEAGLAQSVEVWEETELVGGLYGIKLGAVFCGESMFNRRDSAAKFAFCNLATRLFQEGYQMIDCQIPNDFLSSLGVKEISRKEFEAKLERAQKTDLPWPKDWPPTVFR